MRPAETRQKPRRESGAEIIVLHPRAVRGGRKRDRKRVLRWVAPVDASLRAYDPLVREEERKRRGATGAAYLLGAVLFHVAAALVLIALGKGGKPVSRERAPKNVLVQIAPPAAPEPVPALAPEPVPEADVPPSPEPPVAVKEKPVKSPKPARRAVRDTPADPVNIPDATPPSDAPTPRKVVGISFESTVTGGSGPAMAVGNTRMGRTEARAADPKSVEPATGGTYRGPATGTGNRVAAAIPGDEIRLVKPKRLSRVTPEYPSVLKAQGIEGDVAVLIRISSEGQVLSARVVKGSGRPDFDRAALAAAEKERFSPALRNGEAVEYTLKYTYRFRVTG